MRRRYEIWLIGVTAWSELSDVASESAHMQDGRLVVVVRITLADLAKALETAEEIGAVLLGLIVIGGRGTTASPTLAA